MAKQLCDICHSRPATVRVTVLQDGKQKQLGVCDYHYAQLTRHQRSLSPLESLFGNSLLREFFGDQAALPPDASWRGSPSPSPETMPVEQHFSDYSKELLQRAAEKAVELGNRDVDSEHLLYVLADNDVVQAILKQFKISPQELKDYIDKHAPRGTADTEKERQGEIGVSPRVKSALDRAMQASVELGHS
jgi:ATP-dependent Clp protease ATP-binding subunit ClpC